MIGERRSYSYYVLVQIFANFVIKYVQDGMLSNVELQKIIWKYKCYDYELRITCAKIFKNIKLVEINE